MSQVTLSTRRLFPVFALLTLVLNLVPLTPFAGLAEATAPSFTEDFTVVPNPPWTATGALVSVEPAPDPHPNGPSGNVLKIQALNVGETVSYERNVSIPFAPTNYTVSLYIWNEATYSDSDAWLTVTLTNGTTIKLDPTYGSNNNRVAFNVDTTKFQLYPNLYAQQTWYELRIKIDAINHTVGSDMRDVNGNLLYNSHVFPIPENETGIAHFAFKGTYAGTDILHKPPYKMLFDTLRVINATAPTAPVLSAGPGPGAGQNTLTWTPPEDDGGSPTLGYNVYAGNESNNLVFLATTALTNFTESNLGDNTTRYYKVTAVNAIGESPFSNEASATTFAKPTPPQALTASPGPHVGQIFLDWETPADSGNAENLTYDIYRGTSSGNGTLLQSVVNATDYTDAHLPNGTRYFYHVVARNPAGSSEPSNEADSMPRPDTVTAPYNVTLSPGLAWSGMPRVLNFTYRATVSECSVALLCPVTGEWAVWAANGTGDMVLIASGNDTRDPTAQTVQYTKSINVTPAGPGGVHQMIVAVNTRTGSTAWNATGLLYANEIPAEGAITNLSGPDVTPTRAPAGEIATATGEYIIFQSQCAPTQTCPVRNEWQLLLRGGELTPRGAILRHGEGYHTGHKGNETFPINTSFMVPNVASGNYSLVLAVRHNATAPWVEQDVPFRVDSCSAYAPYRRVYSDPLDVPAGLVASPHQYTLSVPGLYTRGPVTLYNACQPGEPKSENDTDYEVGRGGGILIPGEGEDHAMLTTYVGGSVGFVTGVDRDGSGTLGDSATDCVSPPAIDMGPMACTLQPGEVMLFFLLDDPDNPYAPRDTLAPLGGGSPNGGTDSDIGGYYRSCGWFMDVPPLLSSQRCPPSGYQADRDGNGLGDQYEKPYKDAAAAYPEIAGLISNLLSDPLTDFEPDGLNTFNEYRWDTVPIGPLTVGDKTLFPNGPDYDGDNWKDGEEALYWNDPSNDPAFGNVDPGMAAPRDPDMKAKYGKNALPGGSDLTTVHNWDADGDGLADGDEYKTWRTYPEFHDSDCAANAPTCPTPDQVDTHKAAAADSNRPGTGDNIEDARELQAWQKLQLAYPDPDTEVLTWDRDGDGTLTNLLDPDSDGDGKQDGQEFRAIDGGLCPANCTNPIEFDTDKDGLLDGNDITTASSQDPRWSIFEREGIVYAVQADGSRKYIGELSQGTDPLSWDTNQNGIKDGDEVGGVIHPPNLGYEDYDPLNVDVIDLDEQAASWLENGTRELWAYTAPVVDLANETTTDLSGFLLQYAGQGADAFAPILDEVWNVDHTVLQVVDCVNDLPTGPALESVQCLVGVTQEVVANTLTTIQTVDPATFAQNTLSNLTNTLPIPPLDPTRDDFVPATIPPGLISQILPEPLDLPAGGPTPPDPWGPNGYEGTPVEPILWNDSHLPQFLAATYGSTGLNGFPFDTIAEAVPPEVVRNVDAGFFNVIVNDTEHPVGAVCSHRPVGVPVLIRLDGNCSSDLLDADISVTAQIVTGPTGTQEVEVKLQNMKADDLLSPMKVLAVAFIQVPVAAPSGNTGIVAALGNDARFDARGMPAHLTLRVGTNAVQNATLGQSSYYTFHIESSDPTADTHPVAAYYHVTENLDTKEIVRGELAELQLVFSPTPSVADGNISMQEGGFHLTWTGSPVNMFNAKIFTAHGGHNESVNLTANGLPATLTVDFFKKPEHTHHQHIASASIPRVLVAWENHAPTKTGELKVTRGYLDASSIPAQVTFDMNRVTKTATFTPLSVTGGSDSLGSLDIWSQTYTGSQETPCYQAGHATEYVIFNETEQGTCLTAHLTDLSGVTLDYSKDLLLTTTRASQAPRLTVQMDSIDGSRVYVDAMPWPTSADVKYARGVTNVSFNSATSASLLTVNVTMHTPPRTIADETIPGMDLNVVALDLPKGVDFLAEYPTGSVNATALLTSHIRDLTFRFVETGATAPNLGEDDGIVLNNDPTKPAVTVVRLREFGSARFSASIAGVTLLTDTDSQSPFHLQWVGEGNQWVTGELPRIPKNVVATIEKDTTHFAIRYNATEAIPNLGGRLNLSDGQFTVAFKLEDFPHDLSIVADMVRYTVDYHASSAPGLVEAHLVGADGTLEEPTTATYLVLDQLHSINLEGGGNVPQFHVKFKGVTELHGNFSAHNMALTSKSDAALMKDTTIRYWESAGGWFNQNITGTLPPELNMSFNTSGFRWNATPGFSFSGTGSASFTDFQGRWNFTNLPAVLVGSWNKTPTMVSLNLTSSSDVPLLDFNGSMRLVPDGPESIVRVLVKDLPHRLGLRGDSINGSYTLNLSDKNGNPQAVTTLEAAYVVNKSAGFPRVSGLPGAVAYGRFADADPTELFFRIPHVYNLSARLVPDALNGLKRNFSYRATVDQAVRVDIVKGDTSLQVTADTLPKQVDVSLLLTDARANVTVTATGSTSNLVMEWTNTTARVRASTASLPSALFVDYLNVDAGGNAVATIKMHASSAVTGSFSMTNPGESLDRDTTADYVTLRQGQKMRLATRVTGMTDLLVDTSNHHIVTKGTTSRDMELDLATFYVNLIGTIEGLPGNVDFYYPGGTSKRLEWESDARTTNVWVHAILPTNKWFHVEANDLPTKFSARYDDNPAAPMGELQTKDETAFGSVLFLLAANGCPGFPKMDSLGAAFELAQGTCISVNMTNALRIYGNDASQLDFEVKTTEPMADAQVHFHHAGMGMDLQLASFPKTVTGTFRPSSTTTGMYLDLEASSAMGSGTLGYVSPSGDNVNVTVTNLPDQVTLWVEDTGEWRGLDYSSSASANSTVGMRGNAVTSKGWHAHFDVTQIPASFSMLSTFDADGTGIFSYEATSGQLSGEVLAGPVGSRIFEPPGGGQGASVSLSSGNEHAWMRVQGLQRLFVSHMPTQDRIEVGSGTRDDAPLHLYYENDTFQASLDLSNVPSTVNVTLNNYPNQVEASYAASSTIDYARVQAVTKGENGDTLDANVTSAPKSFDFDMKRTPTRVFANFTRDEESTAPDVALRLLKPEDTMFATATLEDIPTGAHIEFDTANPEDPTASESSPCPFALNSSGSIGFASFLGGLGEPKVSKSLRGGDAWVGLNFRDPRRPTFDVQAKGVKDAMYCKTEDTPIHVIANLTHHQYHMNVSFQDETNQVTVQLDRVAQGDYDFKIESIADTTTITYTGPGGAQKLGHVHVRSNMPFPKPILENKTVFDYRLEANEVPAFVKLQFAEDRLILDSNSRRIEKLAFNASLLPSPPGPAAPAGPISYDVVFPNLFIDAAAMNVSDLLVQLADNGKVRWDGPEPNQFAYRQGDNYQVAIRMVDFTGAQIEMKGIDGIYIHELKVKHKSALRVYASPGDVHLVIPAMPPNIFVAFGMRSLSGPMPGTAIPRASVVIHPVSASSTETIMVQATIGGFYFEIKDIPANADTTMVQVLGAAATWGLKSSKPVKATTQFIVDGTHFITTKITGTVAEMQADIDGAAKYAEERFFDFTSAAASSVEAVAKWGANGMSFLVQNAQLGNTVLVGGKKEPTTGVSFFRNGEVGASQGWFQFLIDGGRYESLQDLW